MNPGRSILGQGQHWPTTGTVELVPLGKRDLRKDRSGMHHGQEVMWIIWIEGPEVHDLLAVGVDDAEVLVLFGFEGDSFACWNNPHSENSDNDSESISSWLRT